MWQLPVVFWLKKPIFEAKMSYYDMLPFIMKCRAKPEELAVVHFATPKEVEYEEKLVVRFHRQIS